MWMLASFINSAKFSTFKDDKLKGFLGHKPTFLLFLICPITLCTMLRGGHFLCRVVRDARLYMVCFWEIFCTFSAIWVPFFNKISAFFLQGWYLFWRKFLYLSNKMEPICKKFSVLYSTKLLHFTHNISVHFYKMGISSIDLL